MAIREHGPAIARHLRCGQLQGGLGERAGVPGGVEGDDGDADGALAGDGGGECEPGTLGGMARGGAVGVGDRDLVGLDARLGLPGQDSLAQADLLDAIEARWHDAEAGDGAGRARHGVVQHDRLDAARAPERGIGGEGELAACPARGRQDVGGGPAALDELDALPRNPAGPPGEGSPGALAADPGGDGDRGQSLRHAHASKRGRARGGGDLPAARRWRVQRDERRSCSASSPAFVYAPALPPASRCARRARWWRSWC